MFVVPTVVAMFVYTYLRPHEFVSWLDFVTFGTMFGLVLLGYVLDLRLGLARPRPTPMLAVALAFFGLCLLNVAVKAPDTLGGNLAPLSGALVGFLIVSQGIQGFRAFGSVAAVLLVITLLLAVIGVRQGMTPSVCYAIGPDQSDDRPCKEVDDCRAGGRADTDYMCEKPGPLKTHSIGGRVRYRGFLQDPNELSWAIGMGIPMAFALYERRRTKIRLGALLAMLGLGLTCVVMTQSRSGQLTLVAVFGVYFVRRFGWRLGAIGGAVASIPVILLGGRSGSEADESAEDRLEAWAQGLEMWRDNVFIGVGQGQFLEHHFRTAHSAFILTLAEMGSIGFLLWVSVIYLAFKTTIRAQIELAKLPEAQVARTWGAALQATLIGLVVSAAFLSISYHPILWLCLGLAGAYHAAVRTHHPSFTVRFGWRDFAAIFVGSVLFVAAVAFYLRRKGF